MITTIPRERNKRSTRLVRVPHRNERPDLYNAAESHAKRQNLGVSLAFQALPRPSVAHQESALVWSPHSIVSGTFKPFFLLTEEFHSPQFTVRSADKNVRLEAIDADRRRTGRRTSSARLLHIDKTTP